MTDIDPRLVQLANKVSREQLELAAFKQLVRSKLSVFIRALWNTVRPGVTLLWNWHIDVMCYYLELVSHPELHKQDERLKRLILNVPPGSMKSLTTGVFWPAWVWLTKPEHQFIFSTYQHLLTQRDAVTTRQLLDSPEYKSYMLPNKQWGWDTSQDTKIFYKNTFGGYRISVSVDGAGTGLRANCFRGDTLISTELGPIPIRTLATMHNPPKVWAYDHKNSRTVLRRIEASRAKLGEYGTLVTTNGILECSDDHPIFTEQRGYVRAQDIRTSDALYTHGSLPLCFLSEADRHGLLRSKQKNDKNGSQSNMLLQNVQQYIKSTCKQIAKILPYLWLNYGLEYCAKVLFGTMRTFTQNARAQTMSYLSTDILSAAQQSSVLRMGMFQCSALSSNDRQRKFKIQRRTKLRKTFQINGDHSNGTRLAYVYTMLQAISHQANRFWREAQPNSASLRRKRGQQLSGQLDNTLPRVSYDTSSLVRVSVSSPWVSSNATDILYDLQVEECRNFFANGICSHNCVVFDDPINVKKTPTTESLMAVNDWWDSRMSTRLNDPSADAFVGIMQRVHELDLTGWLLQRDKAEANNPDWIPYEVIEIPAEYRTDRPALYDPRRKEGELFFPERFPQHVLDGYKKTLGDYQYEAQFQQNPFPSGGGLFQVSKLKLWVLPGMKNVPKYTVKDRENNTVFLEVIERPNDDELSFHCQSWDCAFKDLDTSDFVCGQVWAYANAKFWMLDQHLEKMGITKTMQAIRDMSKAHPSAYAKYIEDKANGTAVIEMLKEEIMGLDAVTPKGGKESRAQAIVPFVDAGNIVLPHPAIVPSVGEMIDQLVRFPKGGHDDCVDAMSQALNKMALFSGDYLENMVRDFSPDSMSLELQRMAWFQR